jgi:1-acyl-sn-glycerol-3-phosphate acyltransferase
MIDEALSSAIRICTGVRARWINCTPESAQPRVYFANHTTHLDFVVLWSVLPPAARQRTRPAAARDYWSRGRVRLWMATHVFRAALIEREHVTRTNNPVDQLAGVLASGDSLILFPEGTRGSGTETAEFKSGLYHLAKRQPQVELVPAYIENLNRVLPKGEILPVPLICHVTFGAPERLGPMESKDEFLVRMRDAVLRLRGV